MLIRRVLEIASKSMPELNLGVALGWGTINLSNPKFFGVIAATKQGIRVYFEWGTLLDDPAGYITRFGRRTAQKDIKAPADIDAKILKDLFRQASELANNGSCDTPPGRRSGLE